MRIGEVIETNTAGFWAESTALHELPPLGSLVSVTLPSSDTIVGVVAFGQTAGVDSGRQAVLRGTAEIVDEGIYAHHPELAMILRTTFRAITVGYREAGGTAHHFLSPYPPPLHYSVARCTVGEARAFVANPRYFPMLLAAETDVPAEQVLAAHIRTTYQLLGDDAGWLTTASQQVARLLKRDYDRLVTILEAIDPGGEDQKRAPTPRPELMATFEPPTALARHDDTEVPF